MRKCELCVAPARTYCESDQAILCWDCDAKVHGANFLVARHSRNLLCNECNSPTPWKSSGATLGRAVSICDGCASERCEESEGENDEDLVADNDEEEDDENELDDFEHGEGENRVEDEVEGVNQVAPSSSAASPPPPAVSSSGSEDDISETVTVYRRKRIRQNCSDLHFPDDGHCSSLHRSDRSKSTAVKGEEEENTLADSKRSVKRRRDEPERLKKGGDITIHGR